MGRTGGVVFKTLSSFQSNPPVFGPGNDFVLKLLREIAEIIAVASHPYNEVAVLFRMFLGGAKCGCVHDVKLDVVVVQPEIGPDQMQRFSRKIISMASDWLSGL